MRAEVSHSWAVTRGNRPDEHPYYCPLPEYRHGAAVNLYRRLLDPVPDDASHAWVTAADMAVVIPHQNATFWYQLAALIETSWEPVGPDTDLDTITAAARTRLCDPVIPLVLGDHPATTPAPDRPSIQQLDINHRWLATRAGTDPNTDTDAWSRLVLGQAATYQDAYEIYIDTTVRINRSMPGPPDPIDGIAFWHCLQAVADTPWTPAHQHVDPHDLIEQIRVTLTQHRDPTRPA